MKSIKVIGLFFLALLVLPVMAQTDYKDEASMIKDAEAMFLAERYADAKPLFSQLVSLYPKNASYNMKYGVCLFYDDEDKSAGLKYLKYAAGKSEAGPESNYYYGLVLHSNYDFNKAIKQYTKFKNTGNKKQLEAWQVDRKIEMCNNGKTLLKNVYDLNVIDKKSVGTAEFFRVYDLGEIGGKIIVKPDEFKSKLDLKSGETMLIHLPADATVIYFSGYGDSKGRGKDIFRVRKKADNTWSEPENIGDVVNTQFDEDYPFMHPDGTLYFASKGHNSMGGYDLFKSEYNESTGTWSKPENLNFAISSAFDEMLFITDLKKQLAYFASNRNSELGKLNVYRVQIARRPFDKAYLSGNFIAEGDTEIKSAKITIYDLDGNQKIGTYFTNKETGKYNISLPEGGKTYKFVVETDDDSPVHTGKVEVPKQDGLVALKQEIRLVGSGDDQKLVIKNLFNETEELDDAALASALRTSSQLDVNATEEEVMESIANLPPEEEESKTSSDAGIEEQYAALILEMESVSRKMNSELSSLKNQIAFGFKYSYERAVRADQMYDQVEVTRQNALNEKDASRKQSYIDELQEQNSKLRPIASDAIVSYDFTKSLANEYSEKINDIDNLNKDLAKVKNGASLSDEDKEATLNVYGPMVEDMASMRSAFDIAPQRYSDLLKKAKEKLQRQEVYYKETKQDIDAVKAEIQRLEKEVAGSKNNKAIAQLNAEKDSKEIDLQDLQFEFDGISKKYREAQKEVKNLESDSKQINDFIAKIKANETSVSQLSSDDQGELNKIIDFLKEQRMLDDVIGSDAEDVGLAEAGRERLSKAQKYEAVDNQGNSVNYDELYAVNLAAIELIADEKERYEQTSELYENWVSTLADDREIKENDLKYTEKKADKDVLQERIRIIEEKEREYRQISVEYAEKAVAAAALASLDGSAKTQEGQETSTDGASGESAESGENTKTGQKQVQLEGLDEDALKMEDLLLGSIYASGPGKNDIESINETYEEAKKDFDADSKDPADEIALAAFELQWAKSIDELIDEQQALLEDEEYKTDWPRIQELIEEYEAERAEHLKAASSEFTQIQIDQQMGEESVALEDKYFIAFDPSKPDRSSYNAEYQSLVDAVENHQILSREEKDRELSMIHNYWSMTIQDDILWHEKEKTKLKSQAELQQLENEIYDLNIEKKVHVNLSNEFYEKYKNSATYSADLAKREEERKAASEVMTKDQAATYGEYAQVYSAYQAEQKAKLEKMQADMDQVGNKGEKQQLQLAMALENRSFEQNQLAAEELENNPSGELTNEEAQEALKSGVGNWKEQSEDYVFAKKDFSQQVPENASAYAAFAEAKRAYDEVLALESQKAGLMQSSVYNKDAEAELIRIQEEIEAKKLEAYESLAKANKLQFESNQREIKALLEFNPDLEKTNPKLARDIKASEVIYAEAEKYLENARGYKSKTLKFDIYDQAQFMTEYVLGEQNNIISSLQGETYTGDLSFMAVTAGDQSILEDQVNAFKISQAEMDAILTNPIYVEYEEDRRVYREVQNERMQVEAMVIDEEAKLKTLVDQRNLILQEAAGQKGGKKKKLMKEAEVLDAEIQTQQNTVDSVALVMVQLKEQENNINRNSARLLKQASVEDAYKMVMLAELRLDGAEVASYVRESGSQVASEELQEEVAITEREAIENIQLPGQTTGRSPIVPTATIMGNNEFRTLGTEIPTEIEGDLFVTAASATVSPYNENKPIPVDVDMPEGLIFKVQVGAYRNAIPQDLFKGFAPLMGERLDNGITRYTAGLFLDFGNANKAKNEIRKLGYEDAFVVAFYNGKRISFQELQNLDDVAIDLPPPVADNTYNGVPPEVLTTPSIIDDPGEVSSAIAEQTTNTREIKGVFFAVQVGVYTNTLVPENLKVLRELNSELLPNGNVRYSVGQFKTLPEARDRQADVQGTVSDAFVTAYSDGQRITVGEALRLLGQSGQ